MKAVDRILGEAEKPIRPPTEKELTDPQSAYKYARYTIKGRFPEGEATIATDPEWAYLYALHVIKGRFPEGEAAIATSPVWAQLYARDIIKGRWSEAEATIFRYPGWADLYLEAFPEAKIEWLMNGWLDWLDT